MSELRAMIRELLLEELGKAGQHLTNTSALGLTGKGPEQQNNEVVLIRSSADLARFATRVLALAVDPETAKRIRRGDHPFLLAENNSAAPSASGVRHAAPAADKHFEKGVISEKDVARLTDETGKITCSPTVCLTPLARDALRRRGIKIVRKTP